MAYLIVFLLGMLVMGLIWAFARHLGRLARASAARLGHEVNETADDVRARIDALTKKLARMDP